MKNTIQKVKMTKNDIYEEEEHWNSSISIREIEFHEVRICVLVSLVPQHEAQSLADSKHMTEREKKAERDTRRSICLLSLHFVFDHILSNEWGLKIKWSLTRKLNNSKSFLIFRIWFCIISVSHSLTASKSCSFSNTIQLSIWQMALRSTLYFCVWTSKCATEWHMHAHISNARCFKLANRALTEEMYVPHEFT